MQEKNNFMKIRQVSNLKKIRQEEPESVEQIKVITVLQGERVSYQVVLENEEKAQFRVEAVSPIARQVKLYLVRDVVMDQPAIEEGLEGEDYLSLEPGMMPDVLVPLSEQGFQVSVSKQRTVLWVRVDVGDDLAAGAYPVTVRFTKEKQPWETDADVTAEETTMELNVLACRMPEQRLHYTRWFYADCIATHHNVEIYSEEHWVWIEKYIAAAADAGINMILVPIHTPPLDTAVGMTRPCVQLVEIEKTGETYRFDFEKFQRFIEICKRNGIQYFEMAHLFSQWGAKCAANIQVTENGEKTYHFGWHTPADSPEYTAFLRQYLGTLEQELVREGISENTYFHISDEPSHDQMESYRSASEMIRSMIGESKTMDALSDYDFYAQGLVECPVTGIAKITEFLQHHIENQWVYYCCYPGKIYPNSFLAMPSRRVRILGFLLYKFEIKGFLHWGFNFYHSQLSRYSVNPYLTTSADHAFPSGDGFIVYPGKDTVYPSIRGEILYEAIQDLRICEALEVKIGREAVTTLIDEKAGTPLTFETYPKTDAFLEELRAELLEQLKTLLCQNSRQI